MPSFGQGRAYRRATAVVTLLSIALIAALAVGEEASAAEAATGPAVASGSPESANAAGKTKSSATRTRLLRTEASPRISYFYSGRKARFDFELAGPSSQTHTVIVKAIRLGDGEVKRRWRFEDLAGKDPQRVSWNGKRGGAKSGWTGRGKHVFKVFEPGGGTADMSKSKGAKRFRWYGDRFPLRAKHSYGDGFGAGRNHRGQDVFARCGKPVLAARGGKVQYRGYHSAAGNYVVIDGRGTGRDYVYMHLQNRQLPKTGAKVRTGERIGFNGETGNASGCHVHFELWSAPGWYEGGRAVPPTKPLRRWDSWS